jgi:hypothetical protein
MEHDEDRQKARLHKIETHPAQISFTIRTLGININVSFGAAS